MFKHQPTENEIALEGVIAVLLADLRGREHDDDNYPVLVDQLTKLDAVRTKKDRVSKDALVAAGATVLSVLTMVGYEHGHVIASKALSFIPKPR